VFLLSEGPELALSEVEGFPRPKDHFKAAREHVVYLHVLDGEIQLLMILLYILHVCEDIISLKNDFMQAKEEELTRIRADQTESKALDVNV
jgi:hypothetical protein